MTKLVRLAAGITVLVVGISLMEQSAFALGFRNPDQDARATGQGEAFVAQADDASAIYYNPAGMSQLPGTEITSGAMISFPNSRLQGAGAGAVMNTMAFLPHFYVSTDLGAPKSPWRFGLGFNVPFGNEADFSKNGPFRYIATETSLSVFNIQPTVSYQVNDQLSLGAGLNVYYGQTELNNRVPVVPGTPSFDGRFHFDGDGTAVGGTAGLMWKITPQVTFGAVYRSPFRINFEGDAVLKTPFGNDGPHNAHSSIQFPQSAAGGLAYRPIKKLKLEVDVEWTDWDSLNNVVLHSTPSAAFNGHTIPFKWQSSMYYEFGAQYDITDQWVVRGGYIYSENTVPGNTFSPTVPDSERHVFSAGLGYALSRIRWDIVYQYSLSRDRKVTIPLQDGLGGTASGTWKSDGHAVMLTSTMFF